MEHKKSSSADRRKVQLTGISTYTVSLPKPWVVKNKISPGDEIIFDEKGDGGLELTTTKSKKLVIDSINVKLDDYHSDKEFLRALLANYLAGYEKVVITSKGTIPEKLRREILKQEKRLIGTEIVEEDSNRIVIQDFFTPEYLSIEKSLRRAFNIVNIMLRDLFKSNKPAKIREFEREIDRINYLVRRQLNLCMKSAVLMQSLKLTIAKCLNYMLIMAEAERMADSIEEISNSFKAIPKLDSSAKKLLITINNDLQELLLSAVKALFSSDVSLANKVIEDRVKIKEELAELNKYLKKNSSLNSPQFQVIFINLDSIRRQIVEIVQHVIDMVVPESN